jgi:hypothetical protein
VQQFLKVFLDIVLWRRGPQDLPSSKFLVFATLLANELVSALHLVVMHESAAAYFVFLVIDPLLLMGWIWLVLRLFNRSDRYAQTISAVLGTSTLLALLLSVPLLMLAGVDHVETRSALEQALAVGLIIAFVLVAAHILKIATESNLFTGIAVALTYVIALNAVAAWIIGTGT